MTPNQKHTPTPWNISQEHYHHFNTIKDKKGNHIANCSGSGHSLEEAQANAFFIVKAVNSHEKLVEALSSILEIGKRDMSNPKYDGYFENAKQTLKDLGE